MVRARGPERNAPEASVGLSLGHGQKSLFPPEEAGGIFSAPSTKKSAPYDSRRAGLAPGPWKHLALVTHLTSKNYCFAINLFSAPIHPQKPIQLPGHFGLGADAGVKLRQILKLGEFHRNGKAA